MGFSIEPKQVIPSRCCPVFVVWMLEDGVWLLQPPAGVGKARLETDVGRADGAGPHRSGSLVMLRSL